MRLETLPVSCVFSMTVRLAFTVIVKLYVMRLIAHTLLVFSGENVPRRNPVAFLGFTFLVFSRVKYVSRSEVIVHSYDTRATALGFRVFFQLKRASRNPFQTPCVFSMKVCLAFEVVVNLHVMRPAAP